LEYVPAVELIPAVEHGAQRGKFVENLF